MKQHLEINGRKLCIKSAGPDAGPVILFLHHGLGAIRSWKDQIPVFSAAGYQVLAYDRWGHGESAPRERWSMPEFEPDLWDLESILTEFGVSQTALISHSDGANIAMHYALSHPDQVSCLVLTAAHIYIEPKMIAGIKSVRDKFESDQRFRSQMQRVHGANAEKLFWGWFNGWSNPAILDWDMRPEIKQISIPTLVVQGLEDEHATPRHARDLAAAIPEAELWLVPGVDHMLPQNHPEEFNQRALQFLEQVLPMIATYGK